jgi:hypothetical protein
MTIDEHLRSLGMSATAFGKVMGLSPLRAWRLRARRTPPDLELASRIIEWSGGAVSNNDMVPIRRKKTTAE